MKNPSKLAFAAATGLVIAVLATPVAAAPVYCAAVSTTNNYMAVDSTQVDACLRAGIGNIGQAAHLDPFLTSAAGAGWANISGSFLSGFGTTTTTTGTWWINAAAWSEYAELAIGFKFGTGNKPDEWFVFSLEDGVSSGNWQFFNVGGTGGGLSHLVMYGRGKHSVPEPGMLGLLGLGLAGIGVSLRRRRKAKA